MAIVLLPPSETKTSATGNKVLQPQSLAFPELNPIRERLFDSLIKLSDGSRSKARTALGISVKQEWEIERNQILRSAPVGPAWQIYTGVLFDAIGVDSLTSAQLKKLTTMSYVQSALFGLISLSDEIPAYRLSGDCTLPKDGTVASLWAKSISQILENQNELIIDMRSGTYVKLGPIPASCESVVPKILQRMPSGPPKVVSHHNKATKGRILRAMVESKSAIKSVDQLGNVIAGLGADVTIKNDKKDSTAITMEVVVDVL